MKKTFLITILIITSLVIFASDDPDWDKVFPKSNKVIHKKVSFYNRLGINLVADMYMPKDLNPYRQYPALVVGHPFGGVKEQSSGLYAQKMAENGFITIAHDASYNGESGGQPHSIYSPEASVEDFSAAIDFLGLNPNVDRKRIGVIGICGSGGFSLGAAEIDPRIKAVVTVSMYNMGEFARQMGNTPEKRYRFLENMTNQRWSEAEGNEKSYIGGSPGKLPVNASPVAKNFYKYYHGELGHHPRSTTKVSLDSYGALMQFYPFEHLDWIAPRPILFIAGENAHSLFYSKEAFEKAAQPKELYLVKNANHVDLYHDVKLIPWKKIIDFFNINLNGKDLAKNIIKGGNMENRSIFKQGPKGPEQIFTGTTYVNMLVTDTENKFDTQAYDVIFEPKARTYWHSHPGGQLLFITKGKGYYQEKGKKARLLKPGDVVEIPTGVVHWHGAAPDSEFVHLGVSAQVAKGPAEWLGEVTDEEYNEAVR